jgi:hypothetical protein
MGRFAIRYRTASRPQRFAHNAVLCGLIFGADEGLRHGLVPGVASGLCFGLFMGTFTTTYADHLDRQMAVAAGVTFDEGRRLYVKVREASPPTSLGAAVAIWTVLLGYVQEGRRLDRMDDLLRTGSR